MTLYKRNGQPITHAIELIDEFISRFDLEYLNNLTNDQYEEFRRMLLSYLDDFLWPLQDADRWDDLKLTRQAVRDVESDTDYVRHAIIDRLAQSDLNKPMTLLPFSFDEKDLVKIHSAIAKEDFKLGYSIVRDSMSYPKIRHWAITPAVRRAYDSRKDDPLEAKAEIRKYDSKSKCLIAELNDRYIRKIFPHIHVKQLRKDLLGSKSYYMWYGDSDFVKDSFKEAYGRFRALADPDKYYMPWTQSVHYKIYVAAREIVKKQREEEDGFARDLLEYKASRLNMSWVSASDREHLLYGYYFYASRKAAHENRGGGK